MTTFEAPSEDAMHVLRLLRDYHNVLIAGPPATGKSRLLAEVRHWFSRSGAGVGFAPGSPIAFPAQGGAEPPDWLPSPGRAERKVFEITFHQGTKYRDFIGGLMPNTKSGDGAFKVVHGPLYQGAQHAAQDDGAALVIVDEINRGPAVAVFGDAITAIERDKRLLPDGTASPLTASFRVLDENADSAEMRLPHHLYLLAAMNEADTSVEPLDVAFRRRWQLFRLLPDENLLRAFLSLQPNGAPLPDDPTEPAHIYEAAVRSWVAINDRISLGRGGEFGIGHGIFMDSEDGAPDDFSGAARFAVEVWERLLAHAAEVFFGDTRGLAFVIGAGTGKPYELQERVFADNIVPVLKTPATVGAQNVYAILRAAATA